MFYPSRNTKIFLGMVAIGIVGTLGFQFISSQDSIPRDFVDARIQGAIISQNIVNLSNQSASDLETINELDKKGEFPQATDVALKAIQESKDIRDQAVKLSDQVSKMTSALSDIKSFEARQAALEAISSRLALISRLINYSEYLNQLLQALQARFSGQRGTQNVELIIDQINAEITAINNFDRQATQAMNRFDAAVSGR